MNRKIIRMEHADATAKIFGNCDSNAHRIEKQFGVTLRNRETESGDSIIIEGEDMEMLNAAADCVAYLHELSSKTEVITEQSLQYAIDMIAGGQAKELNLCIAGTQEIDHICSCRFIGASDIFSAVLLHNLHLQLRL